MHCTLAVIIKITTFFKRHKKKFSILTRDFKIQTLESDIIKLVPLTELDFERLYEVASDPLIWEQHPSSDRYKREVFESYFNGASSSHTAFIIIDKLTDKIIGSTRYYDYKPEKQSIAIGYTFLAREYWGGHYNKSSKKVLLDFAFQFVDKVYFHIGPTNIRSQKATIKIGATKVGEFDLEFNGKKLMHFEYLIEKKDWNISTE
jgi:RimJ/RimL family protein N-acetyltransferase